VVLITILGATVKKGRPHTSLQKNKTSTSKASKKTIAATQALDSSPSRMLLTRAHALTTVTHAKAMLITRTVALCTAL
jgi:hypothetical protein